MPVPRIDQLEVSRDQRTSRAGSRLWREWCFLLVAFRHFRVRFAVMVGILLAGGSMFLIFEPEKNHTLPRAIFYAWSLIFGEPPEEFPQSVVLRAMFFIMPILG